MKNLKNILLAKLLAMSILGIVPFFLINGTNIIDTVFKSINTPFHFWIALCAVTIITFPLAYKLYKTTKYFPEI
jgi:hypothetical protein